VTIRVTVWNENVHETVEPQIMPFYPDGIHGAIAEGLRESLGDEVQVRTATLDQPEHGLSAEVLDNTDVLLWWGHIAHERVDDAVVERVHQRVLAGMGLIVLHSGHFSKIFIRLMGTTCSLSWRDDGDQEIVWTVAPAHPIADGVSMPFVVREHETYGEFFDVPEPDELIFISSFDGGEVFRSGMTYRRGRGRVFYFSPGDQKYPVYQHSQVRRVLANAVRWADSAGPRELPAVSHLARGQQVESATAS
jgi:trehalose utilization protein